MCDNTDNGRASLNRFYRKDSAYCRNKAMKATRLIALMLAILTASSLFACSSGDTDSDETTPEVTTTETPATTTADPDTDPPVDNPPEDDPPEEFKPIVATGISALTATGSDLRDLVIDVAVSENMTPWGDGGAERAFDGNLSTTKLGGDVAATGDGVASVDITWKTSVPTTVSAYVLYTGNDSASWIGRTPTAWEFYGSTDGENWTLIDKVEASGMEDKNATPYGYTVDEPTAYTSYKLTILDHTAEEASDTDHNNYLFQLNEITLIGTAEGEAETPATTTEDLDALKALGTDLAANVLVDSMKVSSTMTPWDDGGLANLFDGNTTGTKLGGDVVNSTNIFWNTDGATTLKSYILYTGGDSGTWTGRTPVSWVLYGSNDNGVNWKVIDRVINSGMEDKNSTPYGYTVDEPAAYMNYKLHVYATTNTVEQPNAEKPEVTTLLQLNELILIGDAPAAE